MPLPNLHLWALFPTPPAALIGTASLADIDDAGRALEGGDLPEEQFRFRLERVPGRRGRLGEGRDGRGG
jgi:hypothetical protein